MKAYKLEKDIDDNVTCPVCHGNLRSLVLTARGSMESSDALATRALVTKSEYIHSTEQHSKNYLMGNIYLCQKCNEMMFLYVENDTRTCIDCQHCQFNGQSGSMYPYHCDWYNYNMQTGYSGTRRTHCKRIDEKIPEGINPWAVCALCAYSDINYRKKEFSCHCNRRPASLILEEKDLYDPKKACHGFKLNFEKYKDYRRHMDGQGLLFDDSLHIGLYDKMIQDIEAITEQPAHLLWDSVMIPIGVRICTHAMDEDEHLITLSYEHNVFFSEVYPKNGLSCEEQFESTKALLLQSCDFSRAVLTAFSKYVHDELNLDRIDIVKKHL